MNVGEEQPTEQYKGTQWSQTTQNYLPLRSVARGMASRALALLDFWRGTVEPNVFYFTATNVDSGHGQTVTVRALTSGPSKFHSLATPLLTTPVI